MRRRRRSSSSDRELDWTTLSLAMITHKRWRAIIFGLLAIVIVFICYKIFASPSFDEDSAQVHTSRDDAEYMAKLDPYVRKYCSFLEDSLDAQEGQIGDHSGYELATVLVVTRHGDRSPLHPETDTTQRRNCGTKSTIQRENFSAFREFVLSSKFSMLIKVHDAFSTLQLVPSEQVCSLGMLTFTGALQLNRLGGMYRQKYRHLLSFEEAEIQSVSSLYPRTLQSAIAFLYGLTKTPHGFHGPRGTDGEGPDVFLNASYTTHFCTQSWCKCPKMGQFKQQFEESKAKYVATNAPVEIKRIVAKICRSMHPDLTMREPVSVFDAIMGRHVCRRIPLPCSSDMKECVEFSDIASLAKFIQRRSQDLKDSVVMSRMVTAEAAPILNEVVSLAAVTTAGGSSKRLIKHISGHDVTLRPLLIALRLWDHKVPVYGSRLTFELYRGTQRGQQPAFRLLIDGRERTRSLPFCKRFTDVADVGGGAPISLCAVDDLRDFVARSYGEREVADVCADQ